MGIGDRHNSAQLRTNVLNPLLACKNCIFNDIFKLEVDLNLNVKSATLADCAIYATSNKLMALTMRGQVPQNAQSVAHSRFNYL
jgi:hypothetical protein